MSNFEDTLSRMKSLYTYGQELNEGNNSVNMHTLEYHKLGADGKQYGIIKECNKYYIKSTANGKENIAESYDYIGGFCNKGQYEYSSYANALKNLELKLASLNEAYESKVNITTLDPFKKEDLVIEGTEKMKNEIARQRQIMHNVSMLMNESTEIGADRKNDVVMYDGKNPEAEQGPKGDEEVTEKEGKAVLDKDLTAKTDGVDTDAEPFTQEAKPTEDQLKEECTCVDGSCDCECGKLGTANTEDNNKPYTETVKEEDETNVVDDKDLLLDDELENGDEDAEAVVIDIEGDEIPEIEIDDTEDADEIEPDTEVEDEISDEDETEEKEEEETEDELDGESEETEEIEDEIENDDTFEDGDEKEDDEIIDYELELDNEDEDDDEEIDECGEVDMTPLMENKINKIVNMTMNRIMNENELHDFGKHPGYRKKPMTTPEVGQDTTKWGKDINDKSVHNDEPFGQQKGDGMPFNILVDAVTKKVVEKILAEGNGKKKMK